MNSSHQEQIERNIEETRSRIDRNLDEIQNRLSPGEAIDEAVRFVKGSGGELAGSVARGIRNNPVPAALIGAGVGWILVSRLSSHSGADEPADDARQSTRAVTERAADTVEQGRKQALEQGRKAVSASRHFVDEHPMSLAVLGLAAGAGVAALLRTSRREDALLGESSDRVKSAARESAREQLEKVRAAAASASEAAGEAVQEELAASPEPDDSVPKKTSGAKNGKKGSGS